jgi:hypothetical protein
MTIDDFQVELLNNELLHQSHTPPPYLMNIILSCLTFSVEETQDQVAFPQNSGSLSDMWETQQSNSEENHLLVSNNKMSFCDHCQGAKCNEVPFSHSTQATHAPLQLVDFDAWPSPILLVGVYKFYVVL